MLLHESVRKCTFAVMADMRVMLQHADDIRSQPCRTDARITRSLNYWKKRNISSIHWRHTERGSIAFVVAGGGKQNTVHQSCKTELRNIWTNPNTARRIATFVPLPSAKRLMTTSLAYLFAKMCR